MKARNGEIIIASEGYKTKKSCLSGIESVRKNAAGSEVVREKGETKSSDKPVKSSKATQAKASDKPVKSSEPTQTKETASSGKTGGFWAAVKRFLRIK